MTPFFKIRGFFRVALSGCVALTLPLFLIHPAHAFQGSEKHSVPQTHEKARDVYFIGSERVPQSIKEDKNTTHDHNEFIEDDG
jgi:hypothetical protein